MTTSTLRSALLWLLPAMAVCTLNITEPMVCQDPSAPEVQGSKKEKAIQVQYLEIVTPDQMPQRLNQRHARSNLASSSENRRVRQVEA